MRSFLKSRIVAAERKIFEENDTERKVKSENQNQTDSYQHLLRTEYGVLSPLSPAEARFKIRMKERFTRKANAKATVAIRKMRQDLIDIVLKETVVPWIDEMQQLAQEQRDKQNKPQSAEVISNGVIDHVVNGDLSPSEKELA